jgi:diguanylate cyclase (GGDEF)-like protein
MAILTELAESTRALGRTQDRSGFLEELRSRARTLTGAESVTVTLGPAGPDEPAAPSPGSRLIVPLTGPSGEVGSLRAESPRAAAFSEVHAKAVAILAAQAAVMLHAADLQQDAQLLAPTDPLTGLANRREFVVQFEEHLRRARRYQETLAVVFLDVDNLKHLNDRHGHAAGDRALQVVAAAMREWVRQTDEVARLGDDEFAVVLLQADRTTARQVIDRIRATVAELRLAGGGDTPLTLSAGIALYPADGGDTEWLFSRAQAALREAKRRGGGRVLLAEDVVREGAPGQDTHEAR